MRRGSTPTFRIALPFDAASVKDICAFFVQDGRLVLSINDKTGITLEGNEAVFTLSPEQSLAFFGGLIADLQLTVTLTSGEVAVSDIRHVSVTTKYPEDI
jgi:hypothetical protein